MIRQGALVAAFPTRSEAAENLRDAFTVFKRPWYIILVALAASLLLLCAATGNDQALKVVAAVSFVILLTAMRMYGASRR